VQCDGEVALMLFGVNEVFETIQGEATFTGTPSTFFRLQGCDVGCPWCDTKHTWPVLESSVIPIADVRAKTVDSDKFARLTVDEFVAEAKSRRPRHVVITGGEPCIYDLTELTEALHRASLTTQIETSGTQPILCSSQTWVTVSPKFNMPGGFAVRRDALCRANEIKMPVGKPRDLETLEQLMADLPTLPWNVWLQPLSQSPSATKLCIEAAMTRGHRLSIQTHKYLGLR
jgi:7-carboxy-7-deazaguanine synthase